jgi:20S proteasome alpha/beta subunit
MLTPKPHPFPRQPKPPIKRLPRSKYVTIAVGFYRGDGLVLCADTQETISGFKRNVPKIVFKPDVVYERTPCAVFAGAGDGPLVDHLIDKLWRKMATSTDSLAHMIGAMEDELIHVYKRLTPCYHPGFMPDAQFLVGVFCPPNHLQLVEISGPVLTRNITAKAIGCGDTLSSYIEERLSSPKAGLSEVIQVAIYIVDQAKKHVDGCGGETHVVTLTDSGKLEIFPQFQVQPMTKRIEEIDRLARIIAASAMDENIPNDAVRLTLESVMEDLLKARENFRPPR